ncbi:MAG: N-formylglutamate amidohydrolase [Actinomycetia bacterium]|nr:N-formylglutamate amidohydrolase [Actinomycetes bacterium]
MREFATFTRGAGPLVAVALHGGHELRPDLAAISRLSDRDRLREEDPYTAAWTGCAPSRVVVNRSRFEVDCNRPRERAVYRAPEDAWGLPVWREALPESAAAASLGLYDDFYVRLGAVLADVIARHGIALVLDLHSYNHRRDGASEPPAAQEENPDVNLGTGHLDRVRWGSVADAFVDRMRVAMPEADVRENVRFKGGHFAHWAEETFRGDACVLAIEFKKTYMDEWTGELDRAACDRIARALGLVAPALLEASLASA